MFSKLTPYQKTSFQYKAVLEKENQINILLDEFLSSKSASEFVLEKFDRSFYIIDAPSLHLPKLLTSPYKYKIYVPFWCLIIVNQKEKDIYFEVLQNLPILRTQINLTNEKTIEKIKNFLDHVVERANILILIQHLKENLICPDNLIIPTNKDSQASKEIIKEPVKAEPAKKITQSDSRKTGFRKSTVAPKAPNESISNRKVLKCYEVPLVYRRYFMMFFNYDQTKVLKPLLSHFFSNFSVQNKNNGYMYLGLYEKEIYILTFDTKDYKAIESDENSQKFEPLTEEIMKNKNSCIELNIYSMNDINIDALNYFTKHIISAKENEEIMLICSSLIRNDKVRLSKDISEYLLDEKLKKTLRFKIPKYIDNLPVFLTYLRQNLLRKIFSHNIISQETSVLRTNCLFSKNSEAKESTYEDLSFLSSGKNSIKKSNNFIWSDGLGNLKAVDDETHSISKNNSMLIGRKIPEIIIEKSDFSFLFNFLREVNGLPRLLEQIFGWCMFLMFVSVK